MAKIVINMPDYMLNQIMIGYPFKLPSQFVTETYKIIRNGKILPKGHGGLIGVQDAVDNLMEYKEIGIFGNYDKLTILGCIDRIENHVKPIIEADREGE